MNAPELPPGAEERAWEVVRRAYEERIPAPRSTRPHAAVLVAVGAAIVAVAAAASPPGRAVFESVRKAVGVEHAQPALTSLPAPGALLVVSAEHGGVWLVNPNGAKLRLGDYTDAVWSPHGLFVAATRRNELVALDPQGQERWSLARRDVSSPTWEGTRTDTRIAFAARDGLHVVGGDGRGDRVVDRYARGAFAWDRARLHTLAYVTNHAVVLRDTVSGRVLWLAHLRGKETPTQLAFSSDGRRLAVVTPRRVLVLDARGKPLRTIGKLSDLTLGAAFAPRTHHLAVMLRHERPGALDDVRDRRSEVTVVDVDHPGRARLLFAGPGVFGDLAWSPDGRTLLVDWRTANQWLFVRGTRVHAVANISRQFPRSDGKPPLLELANRWCCAP